MTTPISQAAMDNDWPVYIRQVFQRLDNGRLEYGDSSFQRPNIALIGEIQQELMDVSGWSFILWSKLEQIRQKLERCANP